MLSDISLIFGSKAYCFTAFFMQTFETLSFFRGMSFRHPIDKPSIQKTRLDRRPRDSSLPFHVAADDWFLKRFGVRYRSQAVFVTSRMLTAQAYAASPERVMRIVPLGAYRYCWSPQVSDLLFKAKELANADQATVEQFLESANYVESDLQEAYDRGSEVMLNCQCFIAIPKQLLDVEGIVHQSAIVLP